jgi:hypothetical protein
MVMRNHFGYILALLSISLQAELAAAPAPWFKWQSVKTGHYICKQTEPGPGWVRHSGPYLDAGCRKLQKPPFAN